MLNKKETIHSLRKKGYKVRVIHSRHISTMCGATENYRKEEIECFQPRGGKTQIDVTTPAGETVTGISVCSLKDNFNHKTANQIALGRALKQLRPPKTTFVNKRLIDGEFRKPRNGEANWENEGGQ